MGDLGYWEACLDEDYRRTFDDEPSVEAKLAALDRTAEPARRRASALDVVLALGWIMAALGWIAAYAWWL